LSVDRSLSDGKFESRLAGWSNGLVDVGISTQAASIFRRNFSRFILKLYYKMLEDVI